MTGEVAKLDWQGLDYDLKLWEFGNVFLQRKKWKLQEKRKK